MRRIWALLAVMAAAIMGCHILHPAPTLPDRNTVVLQQLVLYADFRLPRQHRLLEELTALRADVSTRLNLPTSDEPIHVFLFETTDEFRGFMQRNYPTLPSRRAFFVETDTRLAVYAYWGDRVAEDLRHEVSHGYLHAVVPNLPLWLDEGLAEYFEVSRGNNGLNRPHLDELLFRYQQGTWKPDLVRLEQFTDIADMEQMEYAEAWAWAHWLLHTTPERRRMLHAYLQALRERLTAPPLSVQIREHEPRWNETLVAHLKLLASAPGQR
jgi:hypothetical protein